MVGNAVPLVVDARPVKKGDSRREIVEHLLDSAQDLVHVDLKSGRWISHAQRVTKPTDEIIFVGIYA